MVRQNFSHGRTKQVVVEKVKRRPGPGEPVARAEPVVIAPKALSPRRRLPRPRLAARPCARRRLARVQMLALCCGR